jgi:hypothetical protein
MTKQAQLLILALLASTGVVLSNIKPEDPKYDQTLLVAQQKAEKYTADKEALVTKYQLTDYKQATDLLVKTKPLTMEEWELYAQVYDLEIKKQGENKLQGTSSQIPVLIKQQVELNIK